MHADPTSGPVAIGYDGSEFSKQAVKEAAALFPGADAVVVSIAHSVAAAAPAGIGGMPASMVGEATIQLDTAAREGAEQLVGEGVALAGEAGLHAAGRAHLSTTGIWQALSAVAEAENARVVVVGARGLSPVKKLFLGSTTSGLVDHCSRPVLVVRAGQDGEG
jgi:nucleotide-binding universal stress UspA family protein